MSLLDQPIVQKCMALSQNISDYFIEQRYLGEVEHEELATPQNIAVIAVNLVLDELLDMGIDTNFTAMEIYESTYDFNVMLNLRELYDKSNFYRLLKSLSEKTFSEFEGVLENVGVPEDFFFAISEFFSVKNPNDERWRTVAASYEHWCTNAQFSKHISAIMNAVTINSDTNRSVVDDHNVDCIKRFLLDFSNKISKLTLIVNEVIKSFTEINGQLLLKYVKEYDRVKLLPDNLQKFAEYYCHPTETEPDFIKEHHSTTWHHIEFWTSNKSVPAHNKEQLVIIVASLVLDGIRGKKLLESMKYFGERYTDERQFIYDLCQMDYDSIIGGVK